MFGRNASQAHRGANEPGSRQDQGSSGTGASGPDEDADGGYIDNGLFDADNALQVVCTFAAQRVTGRLLLSRANVRKELYFARGRLIHSTSTLDTERIGRLMLDAGAVTERQLSLANERVEVQGEKVGQALVALGALSFAELHRWLDRQALARFLEVCQWKEGHYSFRSGHTPAPDVPLLSIDLISHTAEAVETSYSARWLAAYFGRLGNPALRPNAEPPFPLELFRFAGRELRVARLVLSGQATIRESLRKHGKTEDEKLRVLRMLFLLHQTNHLLEAA